MSEFLAEAQVVIRPDTTKFRVLLETQLAAATRKPFTVPVVPLVATGAAGQTALIDSQKKTAAAVRETADESVKGAKATREAAVANGEYANSMKAVRQGAIAQSAALAGLRGSVIGANSAFIAGIAAVLAFGRSVQSAAQLETELNVFRVTVGATGDEMEKVAQTAKDLGRDLSLPGVTATDAAQTFLQLARAGLSVQESLDGARGVLQLAVAAELSFADAAQITASALNAFALEGEEAVNVADLLTNAANASQASIGDMGIALRQSAAIADLAGFSLSETVTFLTQLARAGLLGSDAGTSFRVAMQRLIAPTAAARRELDKLNVNLRDADLNLRPEAFFELGQALEGLGRAQADASRQIIFGNDASRAAAFFARINAQAFREQESALKESGSAAEVAGARNEGFAGSVENLKNQLTALGTEIGEISLPVLGEGADAAALSFGFLADVIANNRKFLSDFSDSLGEDIEKLKEFADAATVGESDFEAFLADVEQGAGVFKRGSDAVDDYLGSLLGLRSGTEAVDPPVRKLRKTENELAVEVTEANRRLSAQAFSMRDVADAADTAASAVSRLAGQQKGLSEQVTRARIAGDEGAELNRLRALRESLQQELAAQEAIIAAPGKVGEATAREAIRNRILPALEATNNEIENIIEGQRLKNDNLARDAAQAASDRDRAILEALAGRRDTAERQVSVAEESGNLAAAIRNQDILQALIKQQIQKIRDQIVDQKTRAAAIRELRLALQASRREEAALRAEQRADIAEERANAIAERAQGLQLDIELADINENDKRRIALRLRRIAQLKKEARLLKLEGNALKENRNERARIRAEIEAILEEDKKIEEETTKGGGGFSVFEFMQKQQGFAANLLGNLIPGFATAGLVGGSQGQAENIVSPTAALQAQAGAGRVQGPTFGQAQTEVDVLKQMLVVLKNIQSGRAAPEAGFQRTQASAVGDGTGGGSGGGQAVS